jgi:hypothetical protein
MLDELTTVSDYITYRRKFLVIVNQVLSDVNHFVMFLSTLRSLHNKILQVLAFYLHWKYVNLLLILFIMDKALQY